MAVGRRCIALSGLLALGLAGSEALAAPPSSAPAPVVPASELGRDADDPLDPHAAEAVKLHLKKLPSGKYLYVGSADERFDAYVETDGTVTFMVDPSFQVQLGSICVVAVCVARTPGRGPAKPGGSPSKREKTVHALAGAAMALLAGAAESYSRNSSSYPGSGQPLPPNWMNDPNRYYPPQPPLMGGTVSGHYGYLPRPNAQMAAFLERSFDFRLDLAKDARRERLSEALAQLPVRLLDVWSDTSRPAAQRRAELLALWEETDREGPATVDTPLDQAARGEVDARRLEAAREARAKILEFVRRHLPRGSPDAFTPAEIDRFNASRADGAHFDPYGANPDASAH